MRKLETKILPVSLSLSLSLSIILSLLVPHTLATLAYLAFLFQPQIK